MENKKVKLLMDLIYSDFRYNFIEDDNGDILLKLESTYKPNENIIYINFNELASILTLYCGKDDVLIIDKENEEKEI